SATGAQRLFPATASAAGGAQRVAACSASARHQFNGAPSSTGTLVRVLAPPVKAGMSQGKSAHRYPPLRFAFTPGKPTGALALAGQAPPPNPPPQRLWPAP